MSWTASGLVEDGNTDALEFMYNKNKEEYPGNYNTDTDEQFEFACSVVAQAFEGEVVSGVCNVSLHGHSDPGREPNRKSLGVSFSEVDVPKAEEVPTATTAVEGSE